jgi:SAM-dependent methyltransferase
MAPEGSAEAALRRAGHRYRGGDRFTQYYVAAKLRLDPIYADLMKVAAREPFGDVVDIGCGRAQLGALLLEAGVATSVIGLDWNDAQLHLGETATCGLALRLQRQDLTQDVSLPASDTVVLVDVLYQLDTAAQGRLLRAAAASARRRVLIRTADPAQGLRSMVTRGLEVLGRRAWPNAGASVNARPIVEITGVLTRCGFAVERAPCWRGTPFANVLLVARRVA